MGCRFGTRAINSVGAIDLFGFGTAQMMAFLNLSHTGLRLQRITCLCRRESRLLSRCKDMQCVEEWFALSTRTGQVRLWGIPTFVVAPGRAYSKPISRPSGTP